MISVNYTTKQGERWDLLAYRFYGTVKSMNILTDANPSVPLSPMIEMGTNLVIPIIDNTSDLVLKVNVPPWKK